MASVLESALPDVVQSRFHQLRRRLRAIALCRGLGMAAVVTVVALVAALLCDYTWELSGLLRAGLLGGVLLVATAAVGWFVVRPMLRPIEDDELASLVEEEYPDLEERLLATVQLGNDETTDDQRGSPFMRRLLRKETERRTRGLDIAGSAPTGAATRWGAIGLAATLLALAPFLFAPHAYGLMWSRFLSPFGNHARVSNLVFDVQDANRVVPRGEDVRLVAVPRWRSGAGELPEAVWINWTDESGERDSRLLEFDPTLGDEDADGRRLGAFTTVRPHVLQGFTYDVSSDGARTERYAITVVDRPQIVAANLDVNPPAYTGRAAGRHDGIVGEVEVFERSKLRFDLEFARPVKSAELVWTPPKTHIASLDADAHLADRLPIELTNGGLGGTLAIDAVASGKFTFELVDEHGLENVDEPPRSLFVVEDGEPTLALSGKDGAIDVLADDVVRVTATATDDVGVAALELHWQRAGADEPHVERVEPTALGRTNVQREFTIDLAPLGLAPGGAVTYRVRTADERSVPAPHEVWSPERTLRIKSDAAPPRAEQFALEQGALRDELEAIRGELADSEKSAGDLHVEAAADAAQQIDFDRDAEIPPLADRQSGLADRLEALAGRFEQHPLFANIADEVRDVAEDDLQRVEETLRRAENEAVPAKVDSLESARTDLAAAGGELDDLVKRFDELAELERELLEIERLAQQAERLANDAADLERQALAPPPADETPEQRAERIEELTERRGELVERRADLAAKLADLLERRNEILDAARNLGVDRLRELSERARQLAEPQDLLAESLRKEAETNRAETADLARAQEEIARDAEELANQNPADPTRLPVEPLDPELVREALAALKRGNLEEAAAKQDVAAEDFERLAAALRHNDALPDDPADAAREIAKRQRDLADRIEASAANEPAAPLANEERGREQRDQAAEQAALQAATAGLDVPTPARPRQRASVDRAAEAVEQLLKNEPRAAADSARKAAAELEALADAVGSEAERRDAARETLQQLRKRQGELANRAEQAAAGDDPDQRNDELAALARDQERLARETADLDAPGAREEQRAAVDRAAAALTDLRENREADVPASQRNVEQALADLDRQLAGEPTAREAARDLAERQAELASAESRSARSDDAERQLDAAEQQRIADELAKVDAPAVEAERDRAERAARNAAEQLARGNDPQANDAVAEANRALDRLAESLPTNSPTDPAAGAEQLAERQRENADRAAASERSDRIPSAAERAAEAERLTAVREDTARLRAGAAAAEDKLAAVESLRKAEEARAAADQLAKQEQSKAGDDRAATPSDELRELAKRNTEAQREAAESLEELRKELTGKPTAEELADEREAERQEAERLAGEKPNRDSLADEARQLARDQAALRERTERLDDEDDAAARDEERRAIAEAQAQLGEHAREQLEPGAAGVERAEALRELDEATETARNEAADPQRTAAEQQQAERALQKLAQRAEQIAENAARAPAGTPEERAVAREQAAARAEQLAERQRDLRERLDEVQRERGTELADNAPMQQGEPPNGPPMPGQPMPGEPMPGEPNAGEPMPGAPNAEQPQQGQPQQGQPAGNSGERTRQEQRQLAREAAEQAVETARRLGPESNTAQEAAEFARQADEAAQRAENGQLDRAAEAAERAAETGERAAEQQAATEGNLPADEPRPSARAGELAERQQQLANELGQQAESASERSAARRAALDRQARQTGELGRELDRSARALEDQPVDLPREAERAREAREQVAEAERAIDEAAEQARRGNAESAAEQSERAAESLRRAAEAGQPPASERPESPLPGETAERLADASRRLEEARRQLAEADPADLAQRAAERAQPMGEPGAENPMSGQPMPGQPMGSEPMEGQSGEGQPMPGGGQPMEGQPGEGQPMGDQPGQGQPGQGQPGEGQPGDGQLGEGQPGGEGPNALAEAARSLQQAADALGEAAQGLQPGNQPGQPGQSQGQAGASQPGQPGHPGQSGDGNGDGIGVAPGAAVGLAPAELEAELKSLAGREWGKLPGHLRTEILDAARRRPHGEYAKLIKLYFKEIARAGAEPSDTPAPSPAPAPAPGGGR